MGPTLGGFLAFIRNVMGIDTTVLPDASPVIDFAYNVALSIVNQALQNVQSPAAPGFPSIYALCIYNLAGSRLLTYGQDLPDAEPIDGSEPPTPFFKWTRQQLGINTFVAGVISSAGDQGTSQSMVTPEMMKNLTFQDLQSLKDPYGRTYLSLAGSYGSLWGLT